MKLATKFAGAILVFASTPPANSQSAPSAFTSATRYDAMGHVTGRILPDPDGTGPLHYAATRNTYDSAGRVVKVERGELSSWESETVLPQNWGTAFTVFQTTDTVFDPNSGLKTKESVSGSGIVKTVTQFNYDGLGRLQCTAVRMDSSQWGSQTDSCVPQTSGQDGPDRVTKNVYDAAGELVQLRKAVGISSETADTYSYTPNGKKQYLIDANGNRAQFTYDGFDRQQQWIFPSPTKPSAFNNATQATALSTAGQTDATDYEQYTYDANGNRVSLRKRDGRTLTFSYDALNRASSKLVPSSCVSGFVCGSLAGLADSAVRNVYYDYDLQGHQLHAKFDSLTGPDGITNTYDGFGEVTASSISMSTSTGAFSKAVCSSAQPCLFDADGNRVQVSVDGQAFTYGYDGIGRLNSVYEGTSAVATASLDQFIYNPDGTLFSRTEDATGASQSTVTYHYDEIDRLQTQADAFPSFPGSNVTWTFTRNAASQISTEQRDNDAFKYGTIFNANATYSTNGLNQYTSASTASLCYDSNGNLTADGTSVYLYDVENRLVQRRVQTSSTCPNGSTGYTGTLQANIVYDPLGRLLQVDQGTKATATDFLYDGGALVAEYIYTAGILGLSSRYVHGTNLEADDPLVSYSSSALSTRSFLHADHLGSIVAMTNGTSAPSINSYDEYGIPKTDSMGNPVNTGRFQYTGQAFIPELGMYYYKARIYSPRLGRFMQTDPIGYKDQINLYDYADNDSVNHMDSTGLTVQVIVDWWNVDKVRRVIDAVTRSNADLARRYNELVASKFNHQIEVVQDYRQVGTDHHGRDTVTRILLHDYENEYGRYTPETVLTHELLGHAFQDDQMKIDLSLDLKTSTLTPKDEEYAVRVENIYRNAADLPIRTSWGPFIVPDPRQFIDNISIPCTQLYCSR